MIFTSGYTVEREKSLYRNEGLLELADVRSVAVEELLQKQA